MAKVIRPSEQYFRELPSDDRIPETRAPERGAARTLPAWMHDPNANPTEKEWDHLRDPGTEPKQNSSTAEASAAPEQQDRGEASRRVLSPFAVIADREVRARPTYQAALDSSSTEPSSLARRYGLALAKRDGAQDPVFRRDRFEGVRSNDSTLPSVSGALLGLRFWREHDRVTSARIEEDKFYRDGQDASQDVGGMNYVAAAGEVPSKEPSAHTPARRITAKEARALPYGKRIQLAVEDTNLSNHGLKGSLFVLPGISGALLNFFADIGPYAQVELRNGVRGNTFIDIERGFGSKVSVRIGVRGQKTEKDWAAEVGASIAHVDNSYFEYAAGTARDKSREASRQPNANLAGTSPTSNGIASKIDKMLSAAAEDEIRSVEDRARFVDRIVSEPIQNFNRHARPIQAGYRDKKLSDHLTLYDLTFNLSNPQAALAFDRMLDSKGHYRTIDIGLLEELAEHASTGVEVNDNRVRAAVRRSATQLFNLFGYGFEHGNAVETSQVKTGDAGNGATLNAKQSARTRGYNFPGLSVRSVTEGRVQTAEDHASGDKTTSLTLDWSFSVDDARTDRDDLAELWSFAATARKDPEAIRKLRALQQIGERLPKATHWGLAIGRRGVGRTETKIRVSLGNDAVRRLLGVAASEEKKDELWRSLAEGYRIQTQQEDAPDWPNETLNDDGILARLRRNIPMNREDRAFVAARRSLECLERAADTNDPEEASSFLAAAFKQLSKQLGIAGALVAVAQGAAEQEGSNVTFEIEGSDELDSIGLAGESSHENPAAAETPDPLSDTLRSPVATTQSEQAEQEKAGESTTSAAHTGSRQSQTVEQEPSGVRV